MTRRRFFSRLGCGAALLSASAAESANIRLRIHNEGSGPKIPDDFLGFGFEISEVAVPEFFSASNRNYIQFVRNLAPKGVIRVGGNTADFASWEPDGEAVARPKGTIVNRRSIEDLGDFLRATGWRLIWALNSGTGSPEAAADQAEAVARAAGRQLLAFEIGNEPDMFVFSGHRPPGYQYPQYLADFRRFGEAIRRKVPDAPLAGPAVLAATDWSDSLAKDSFGQLRLLTQHYYINDQSTPVATLNNLLAPDARLARITRQFQDTSRTWGVPWRLSEVNSFSGGGKPGVSDVFAAALWSLDFLFTVAAAGCAGVNFETGVNHLGFVSSYSPIFQDDKGYSAHPVYYGMLAFRSALGSTLGFIGRNDSASDFNAWTFRGSDGAQYAALLNKSATVIYTATLDGLDRLSRAELSWLTAPGIESRMSITFASAAVTDTGAWSPGVRPGVSFQNGSWSVTVPTGRAVMIRFF